VADAAGSLTVCVTGHDGYIGAVLVPSLVARGHRVIGIDSFLFDRCALPGTAERAAAGPPIAVRVADIRDLGPEAFDGVDAVVHLAGLSNDPLGDLDPALTQSINRDAAIAVAAAAKAAGVGRFVLASTCSVYGAAADELVDEDSMPRPLTAYARSKVESERAILALVDRRFAPVALRFATAFGFSRKLRFDLVANNLLAHALATGRILLKSMGDAWRPLIHVADIADAIAEALVAPSAAIAGATVNVGADSENHRVIEIARAVASAVPSARIERAAGATSDPRSYRVSFARLRSALPGFAPRWTLSGGISDLQRHLAGLALRIEDCEGERYGRLAHLRAEQAAGRLDAVLRRPVPVAPGIGETQHAPASGI
jgi:nucleoside-diphosphate-sugar epimerase